jgi:hypothetical protein
MHGDMGIPRRGMDADIIPFCVIVASGVVQTRRQQQRPNSAPTLEFADNAPWKLGNQ